MSTLVPTFTVDPKATVKIGANTIQSEAQPIDFTKTVTISVTSESGTTRTYMVLAKNGNTKIDNLVYAFMVKHSIPGVSVAISKNEAIAYKGAYGFANKLTYERVTSDHMFRLASMSKQHTAIAIMYLMEQGKLKLTDKVFGKDGLLYKAYGDNMSAAWKDVTVEHLLSHTSGLLTEGFFGAGSAFSGKTLDERINIHLSSPLGAIPGTTYEYNNSNFAILGKIVEELSGKAFMDYLHEDIYGPNGITGIDAAKNDNPIKGEVVHYTQNTVDPYANNVEVGLAAGGVVANAPGLMQLMARIDYGTKVKDILKKETLDKMYAAINVVDTDGDPFNQYALGWRKNYSKHPTFEAWHGGTLAGVCPVWARTTDNVNGVILCNSRSYDKSIDADMRYLLENMQDVVRKQY
ncbi:MAG: beta-lactamase family protein [Clostridia bacterium]|nr:beta-lactamase family protein [Clostridia bacterium]